MMVVKVEIWPGGDHTRARTTAVATWGHRGVNDAGQHCYDVTILKNLEYGGPALPVTDLRPETVEAIKNPVAATVFKQACIGGHRRGERGAWDLIGGSLGAILGDRVLPYRKLGKADFKDGAA